LIRKFREPVNGLTHLAAAFAAAIGMFVLLYLARSNPTKLISFGLYGLTLILMFASSASYHLFHAGPRLSLLLRKLDHSAIYLLIAGSYTPICLTFFTGFWHTGFLAIIWGLAIAGISVKLFVMRAPRWVTAGLYLIMGWLSVLAVSEIIATLPAGAITWLVLGGLFYTVGAVIYILKKPDFFPDVFGFHELWHIFVILGALSHYIIMAVYVAHAA
jgi:hemolysin III